MSQASYWNQSLLQHRLCYHLDGPTIATPCSAPYSAYDVSPRMDFASLMRSQISSSTPSTDTKSASTKYLKRSEVEAQRREAYEEEQRQAEAARLERLKKKRKRDEDEADRQRSLKEKKARLAEESRKRSEEAELIEENARRKRIGLPPLKSVVEQSEDLEGLDDIPDAELKENLRNIGEPVTLFAESHAQRLKRWITLNNKQIMSTGPIPTSLELLEEKDMKLSQSLPTSKDERKHVRRQLASYFDLVLCEWSRALARRTKEVKDSSSGKQAYNSFATAISNLAPLFRKLESDSLPDDLLKPIIEIAFLAQSKRYVDANDAYLRLSIGNTAWPIGVTMVGIHERSAREKLHEDGTAHIMSDETTRKMIQGIKRALTYAQTRWPPDDFAQLMG